MVLANEARSAELAIIISYPTNANGIIVLLNFFLGSKRMVKLPISGKPRENHVRGAPFANLAE